MSKVIRVFKTEEGTFLNTIAYNAVVKTPLGEQIIKDWYSIETKEDMVKGTELPEFNPKQWVIRVTTSTKMVDIANEITGEVTQESRTYTNKWLDEYRG